MKNTNKKEIVKSKVEARLSALNKKDLFELMNKNFEQGYRLYNNAKSIANFVVSCH